MVIKARLLDAALLHGWMWAGGAFPSAVMRTAKWARFRAATLRLRTSVSCFELSKGSGNGTHSLLLCSLLVLNTPTPILSDRALCAGRRADTSENASNSNASGSTKGQDGCCAANIRTHGGGFLLGGSRQSGLLQLKDRKSTAPMESVQISGATAEYQ